MKQIKLEMKQRVPRVKFCLVAILLFAFCFLAEGKSSTSHPDQDKSSRWIPYTLPWDDMPLDLSFIYKNDKPAGERGFLKVEGDKMCIRDRYITRATGVIT